jgi:hypothetical protein
VPSLLKRINRKLRGKPAVKRPRPSPKTAELGFLDGFLSGRIAGGTRLALLQCGANDGITGDPINGFVLRNPDTVTAVMVEPIPEVFAALQANYAGHARVKTLNVGVGPEESIALYRIRPELAAQYGGINASGKTSFDRDYVLRKATALLDVDGVPPEDRIEMVSQTCMTASQIIDAELSARDRELFVQVDAEGFDDQIVYTIDVERHRPVAINYEVTHLGEERHAGLRSFLSGHGYDFIRWSKSDELAIRA